MTTQNLIGLSRRSFMTASASLAAFGVLTKYREWQDTVLMSPREKVEIAFVADNPGGWMFHCHILEHQAGGMMGVIDVA